jgi:hypothetical protein
MNLPDASPTPVPATAFGLLMVAATGVQPSQPAFAGALLAVAAVFLGIVLAPAATAAVAISAGVIAFTDPVPLFAPLSGLCAVAYLMSRHSSSGRLAVTSAPVRYALGFCIVGLVATSVPVTLPWVAVLAPVTVLGLYLIAIHPFAPDVSRAGDRDK